MASDSTTRRAAARPRTFKRAAFVIAAAPIVLFALQACGGTAVAPTAAPGTTATIEPTVAPPPTVVSDMTQTAPTIVAVASQAASAVASPVASPMASPIGSPAATPAP